MSNRLRKVGTLVVLSILFTVLLAACGPRSVQVVLGQYEMSASPSSAKAGEITFSVQNNAAELVHEFVVVKSDLPSGGLTVGSEGIVDESQMVVIDEIEDMEPGANVNLTVTLEAGHYILLCNIKDHYGLGMHADFTVVP